jgi:UDP-glucose 4-epimerase
MKILVTGGTGYIGSHYIIEQTRNTNWEVISIDNFSNSSAKTLERIQKITGRSIKNYEIDLRNKQDLLNVFKTNADIQGIVHFAALKAVGESVNQPLRYYDNNINGLLNLLELVDKYEVPYFIFSSSSSVYGNVSKLPVDENTQMGKAESPYAHTKQIGESIIENFYKIHTNIKGISLRYFNPVGSDKTGLNGEDPINIPNNLVPVITQVASGIIPELVIFGNDWNTRDGTCIRDYIHVSDIAYAHIKALEFLINNKNESNYEVFNLGTGNGLSVYEVVKAFEESTGINLNYRFGPRRPGDTEAVYSNNDNAEKKLNWKPARDTKEMMTSAWKWQEELNKERKG